MSDQIGLLSQAQSAAAAEVAAVQGFDRAGWYVLDRGENR